MSDKIQDTLAAIKSLFPGRIGEELHKQAAGWAAIKGATAKDSLELGGKLHSSGEKARRQLVRVYLLAFQALGLDDQPKALENRRTEILKLDAGALKLRLSSDIAPYTMILLDEHKLRFGWSFRKPGTSDLQNQLLRAWQRVPAALHASHQALGGLASPTSPDIDHYTTYFGDRSVLNTVKSKLGLVCSMANRSTLCLYYRGKSCADPRSDWPYGGATEQDGIKPTAFVGAANRPKNREGPTALFQIKSHRNALQCEDDIHVMVGLQAENSTMMDMTHMIIHELTHLAAGTSDVKFTLAGRMALPTGHALEAVGNEAQDRMYGPTLMVHGAPMAFPRFDKSNRTPEALSAKATVRKLAVRTYGDDLCRAMALAQPEKAANNADSYAYFCMKYAAPG
jgi:hypothetical protein